MISRQADLNVIDMDVPTFILCMRTCLLNSVGITLDVIAQAVTINNGALCRRRNPGQWCYPSLEHHALNIRGCPSMLVRSISSIGCVLSQYC